MTEVETEYWYRYEDYHTAPPLDEWEQPVGRGEGYITLRKWIVLRYTPKGLWIEYETEYGSKKFILAGAHKRFACPTIEEAQISFLARKKKQLGILETRAGDVRDIITKAKRKFTREACDPPVISEDVLPDLFKP